MKVDGHSSGCRSGHERKRHFMSSLKLRLVDTLYVVMAVREGGGISI